MRIDLRLAGAALVALVVLGAPASSPPAVGAQIAPPSGRLPTARVPAAAQACAGCHGPEGAGRPAENIPRIAGLFAYYSAKQIRSYVDGTRRHPEMEAIARSLSPRDVAIVSAYFAQLEAPVVRSITPASSPGAAERGRLIATVGSREMGVQACSNCHGPDGGGQPPAIPYLAGQGASYMVATMNAWRAGARRNDEGDQMATIARALTPEAIEEVARYYSELPPRPPVPLAAVSPTMRHRPAADTAEPARAPRIRIDSAVVDVPRVSAAEQGAANPERGRVILESATHGCVACHAIPGVRRANGVVGPPLHDMSRRGFIAGQLPNRLDVLVAFLVDPPALVPNTGMPATGITREEAVHVAAYLYSLGR